MEFVLRKSLQIATLILMVALAAAFKPTKPAARTEAPPDLQLEGGRKLTYERSFTSENEVKPKRGFWSRLVDVVAGEPDFHSLVRPYSVVTDSRGRVIVSDPGAIGIHVFDFADKKYKFLSRADDTKNPMLAPQCVAVDAADNIYVTDSEAGKVFVFDANGKYQRVIGSLKGGEGYFKRPTGIAVDSKAQRIYVTDTLRDKIFIPHCWHSRRMVLASRSNSPLACFADRFRGRLRSSQLLALSSRPRVWMHKPQLPIPL